MPERLQRSRARGYRMPAAAIYVGRPTRWGNPWTLAGCTEAGYLDPLSAVVSLFEDWLHGRVEAPNGKTPPAIEDIQRELRGRDLVCWCRLNRPCHADVLIEIANGPECEVVTP